VSSCKLKPLTIRNIYISAQNEFLKDLMVRIRCW